MLKRDDEMKLLSLLKKTTFAAVLGLIIFAAQPFSIANAENSSTSAQKLVDALKAMKLGEVDYLYAYLQSIKITKSEHEGIMKNAEEASRILKGVTKPEDVTDAERAKIGRLFLDSAQKAHLKIAFVDKNGNSVNLSELTADTVRSLVIQVMDLNGNILATIDPKREDFTVEALNSRIAALKAAIDAKLELDKSETFVPMPASILPATATSLPAGIAWGSLLVIIGVLTLIPSLRAVRKLEGRLQLK